MSEIEAKIKSSDAPVEEVDTEALLDEEFDISI